MVRITALAVAGLLIAAGNAAAADHAAAVPVKASSDSRLQLLHDVDNPWPFEPHFQNKDQWEQRRAELRTQVLVAEGLWPLPEKTPLNPVVHGKIDRDDYTIEKVFFASYPGHYVSGNLYRPKHKTGKLPAVLCPHGHWPNGRFLEVSDAEAKKQIASGAETTTEGARYVLQARCAMLARMGCVVFHYDMVGYADSTAIDHRTGFTDAEAELRLQTFMGLQTWNSIRSLDFLSGLPDVDPQRIAVTGASGGGTQTMILCGIDDRPAVSFPAVMVSTAMQGGCICENSSLLRVGTNNVEFAALFAPKPLGMTSANDWTKDLETKGLPELKQIYSLYGVADHVTGKHFSFPHNYNQVSREMMYNWVNDHLKLGWETPVKEKPFVPVPVKELSVYDAEHPRPADTADAKTLRKYLTEASDRQMATLAKEPSEYRRVVRAALRVMVNDELPVVGEVLALQPTDRWELPGGGTSEKILYSRNGSAGGEAVPLHILRPPGWNGSVLIWAHPDGGASLFDAKGAAVVAVRAALDRKSAVICADLFMTGELVPTVPPPAPVAPATKPAARSPKDARYANYTYAGYRYGYNRSVFAERVHDLLTLICVAKGLPNAKSVDLVAFGKIGPCALVARALAGDAIESASIDLAGFDFDQVSAPLDDMMLSGAMKYGGIYGFVPLCDAGRTTLHDARKTGAFDRVSGVKGMTISTEKAVPETMVAELRR